MRRADGPHGAAALEKETVIKVIASMTIDESIKLLFSQNDIDLINFINVFFDKHYAPDAKVVHENIEFPSKAAQDDFADEKGFRTVLADFVVRIDGDIYHFEFQSAYDGTIVLRVFCYGMHKAYNDARLSRNLEELHFVFPQPLVIQLAASSKSRDELKAVIHISGCSDFLEFKVPVLNVWKYTVDQLVEKRWYHLLPYSLIQYNTQSLRASDEKKMNFREDSRRVFGYIRELYDKGQITPGLAYDLLSVASYFCTFISGKYLPDDDKEVRNSMESAMERYLEITRGRERAIQAAMQKVQELEAAMQEAHETVQEARETVQEARATAQEARETAQEARETAFAAEQRGGLRCALNLLRRGMPPEEAADITGLDGHAFTEELKLAGTGTLDEVAEVYKGFNGSVAAL
ncbi:MAG: hypothetical protein LBS62_04725 [Clostridiales bacterium]|jgi:hypothetical protein|nr:hypothetical protein [Clostridiales bacterium]